MIRQVFLLISCPHSCPSWPKLLPCRQRRLI
nr:MAG TPA: hypothetical protein [Caudoviricetes sp.]